MITPEMLSLKPVKKTKGNKKVYVTLAQLTALAAVLLSVPGEQMEAKIPFPWLQIYRPTLSRALHWQTEPVHAFMAISSFLPPMRARTMAPAPTIIRMKGRLRRWSETNVKVIFVHKKTILRFWGIVRVNITLRSALQTTFHFARIFYLHAPANKYAISINISFVNSFLYRFL